MNLKKATNKTIQNYNLEEVKYINSDGSEIWLVCHKLTKKRYMMKKLDILDTQAEQSNAKMSPACREELLYSNLQRQVNILKRLPGDHYPKRNKLIKTGSSFCLVYDMFPSMLLETFLDHQKSKPAQKLQLLIAIAQQLVSFHQRGVVLLNLNINSVHVLERNKIMIRDWGMARNIDDGDIPSFELPAKRKEFIAEEVEKGKYSYASDVFSLGKLISRIVNRGEFTESKPYKEKLEELATKMIQQDYKLRPSLETAISFLQKIPLIDTEPTPKQNPSNFIAFKRKQFCQSTKQLSDFSIGSTETGEKSALAFDLPYFTPKNFSKKDVNTTFADIKSLKSGELSKNVSRPELLNRTLNTAGNNHVSHTILTREYSTTAIDQQPSNLQLAKSICKRRDLAFYILKLAEFVIESGLVFELGFILTKYARLTISSIIKEVQVKMKQDHIGDVRFLLVILKKELANITSIELKLKKKLLYEELEAGVKRELVDDKTISDPLLRKKVLEFGRKMIDHCDEQIINGQAISIEHNLLQTYFILKKIQLGSYQRFWNTEQSLFAVRPSIREKMTPRQILQKVTHILNTHS